MKTAFCLSAAILLGSCGSLIAADLGEVPHRPHHHGKFVKYGKHKPRIVGPVYIVDQGPTYVAAIADSRFPVMKYPRYRRTPYVAGFHYVPIKGEPLRVYGSRTVNEGEAIHTASVKAAGASVAAEQVSAGKPKDVEAPAEAPAKIDVAPRVEEQAPAADEQTWRLLGSIAD